MSYTLRSINPDDEEITFQWVNDSLIRRYSHNTDMVSREGHNEWFAKIIRSDESAYYIMESDNHEPMGSIRFDFKGDRAKINYLVDSSHHGKGLGEQLLVMGEKKLKIDHPKIKEVFGQVYEYNKASVKIFEKLAYSLKNREGDLLTYAREL